MSFLAPLYALAALAVSLPILFHFLQRTPRGRQLFGSLMFLRQTPPKITKRSRISDLLLLALRAAALILIALAFCRPFMRSLEQLATPASQRQIAILVDTSASMRREGLWEQARQEVKRVLESTSAEDEVMVYSFDHQVIRHVGGNAGVVTDNTRLAQDAVASLKPTWFPTNLGRALVTVADELQNDESLATERRIVVVSDIQQGSDLTALQSYNWPAEVQVDFRPLSVAGDNASLHLPENQNHETDDATVRVRVTNAASSVNDQFRLTWVTASGQRTEAKTLQVAPGRSRVVEIPSRSDAERIELSGDAHSFDNTAFVATNMPQPKSLLFVHAAGPQSAAARSSETAITAEGKLVYFLRRAPLGTSQRPINVTALDAAAVVPKLTAEETPLIVFAGPPQEAWQEPLKEYLDDGGRILVVMDPTEVALDDQVPTETLAKLLELDDLRFEVVKPADYSMLTNIEFGHRLFEPFNDAKYNDFTKIRFWQHVRPITEHEQPWDVLARFDDGVPALVERQIGDGTCWVFNSGWNAKTSQLALSTKFVPLLALLCEKPTDRPDWKLTTTGQTLPFGGERYTRVIAPSGQTHELTEERQVFAATNAPGVYEMTNDAGKRRVAVHLPASESRVETLDVARVEQWGVRVKSGRPQQVTDAEQQRQLRNFELEGRQKLWRWLIVAALALLAVETYLAGQARQMTVPQQENG